MLTFANIAICAFVTQEIKNKQLVKVTLLIPLYVIIDVMSGVCLLIGRGETVYTSLSLSMFIYFYFLAGHFQGICLQQEKLKVATLLHLHLILHGSSHFATIKI